MPSVTTNIGLQTIPYPVGSIGSPIEDRTSLVFLSYFAHWIRKGLDAKLADLGGQTAATDEVYTSACPATNLYPYSHESVWPHNPKPALYIWWAGPSKTIPKTLVYSLRERTLNLVWIYCQVNSPDEGAARAGLGAAVDAILRLAEFRGSHPTWSYTDSERTYPAGMNAGRVAGVHDWKLGDLTAGMFAPVPSFQAEGREQNFYPAVVGSLTVWERIGADTFDRMTDANAEARIQVNTSENGGFVQEPVTIAEVVIPNP
jgi:hypothetical protein